MSCLALRAGARGTSGGFHAAAVSGGNTHGRVERYGNELDGLRMDGSRADPDGSPRSATGSLAETGNASGATCCPEARTEEGGRREVGTQEEGREEEARKEEGRQEETRQEGREEKGREEGRADAGQENEEGRQEGGQEEGGEGQEITTDNQVFQEPAPPQRSAGFFVWERILEGERNEILRA